jgi:capsular polysaccharide export protein
MDATERLQSALMELGNPEEWGAEGFSDRKLGMLKQYLAALGQGHRVLYRSAKKNAVALAWGMAPAQHCLARLEDGFIRSVGLGADLVRPLSWVIDTRGIYFDAQKPSDLEWLLQHRQFTELETRRAAALRSSLVSTGLTKYNVGQQPWQRPANGQRVVLIAGQVETDASIKLGSHTVRSNAHLLQEARQRCPGDYLLYKPHPDVLAGLRAGQLPVAEALQSCNEVVTDTSMADLFKQVDAVHVMTSLAGFEALLRGIPVTCYGTPFYAGWGLCTEPYVLPSAQARRERRLTLDQLVAAALIDYPTYLHPELDSLMTPEQAVALLAAQRNQPNPDLRWIAVKRHALALLARLQGRF